MALYYWPIDAQRWLWVKHARTGCAVMRVGTVRTLLLIWVFVFAQCLVVVHTHEPDEECELCLHLSFLDKTLPSTDAVDPPGQVGATYHQDSSPDHFALLDPSYEARAPPTYLAA